MRTILSVLKIENDKVTLNTRPQMIVPLSRCKFVDTKKQFVTIK